MLALVVSVINIIDILFFTLNVVGSLDFGKKCLTGKLVAFFCGEHDG